MSLILIWNDLEWSFSIFWNDRFDQILIRSVLQERLRTSKRDVSKNLQLCESTNVPLRVSIWDQLQSTYLVSSAGSGNSSHIVESTGWTTRAVERQEQLNDKSRWTTWARLDDKCGWTFVFISFYLWNRRLLLSKSYLCDQFLIGYLSKWIFSIWVLNSDLMLTFLVLTFLFWHSYWETLLCRESLLETHLLRNAPNTVQRDWQVYLKVMLRANSLLVFNEVLLNLSKRGSLEVVEVHWRHQSEVHSNCKLNHKFNRNFELTN